MSESRRNECGVTTGVKKIIALVMKEGGEGEKERGREGGKARGKRKVTG